VETAKTVTSKPVSLTFLCLVVPLSISSTIRSIADVEPCDCLLQKVYKYTCFLYQLLEVKRHVRMLQETPKSSKTFFHTLRTEACPLPRRKGEKTWLFITMQYYCSNHRVHYPRNKTDLHRHFNLLYFSAKLSKE